jgi:hypothetical protein
VGTGDPKSPVPFIVRAADRRGRCERLSGPGFHTVARAVACITSLAAANPVGLGILRGVPARYRSTSESSRLSRGFSGSCGSRSSKIHCAPTPFIRTIGLQGTNYLIFQRPEALPKVTPNRS